MIDILDLEEDGGVLGDGDAMTAHARLRSGIEGLSDEDLRLRLRELEVEARQLAAETALVVAAAERRMVHQIDGHRSAAAWLRAETNCSPGRATRQRQLARLIEAIPVVGRTLLAGRIGVDQAEVLARAGANPRCGDQLVDAADLLVEWCEQLSFDEARICITRWESLADADGAHRDRAAAEEQRRAFVGIDDDGAVISASGGSPLVAEEMRSTFDRFVQAEFEADAAERTRRFGPDAPAALLRRTDAQRRFDALTALFRAAASVGHGVGVPASVVLNIVSDERSLSDALSSHGIGVPLGYSGNATSDELVSRRCETESGMQLTAEDLVGIASNEHIRHVIVDSAGTVIDWGRKRRLFTGAAREAALFRARRCGRIGSAVHRGGCQVDHRRGWSDGGRTDQDNADGYCSHDNRKKHELGIIVKRSSSGYIKLAPTRRHVSRSGRPTAPPGRRRARRQSAPTARCAHRRYVIRILIGRRDADG